MQKLASTQLPDHLSGFVVNWRITAAWKENSLEYVFWYRPKFSWNE